MTLWSSVPTPLRGRLNNLLFFNLQDYDLSILDFHRYLGNAAPAQSIFNSGFLFFANFYFQAPIPPLPSFQRDRRALFMIRFGRIRPGRRNPQICAAILMSSLGHIVERCGRSCHGPTGNSHCSHKFGAQASASVRNSFFPIASCLRVKVRRLVPHERCDPSAFRLVQPAAYIPPRRLGGRTSKGDSERR